MGVRKQRSTTSSPILDNDYKKVLQKAKQRYRTDKEFRAGKPDRFYIFLQDGLYFAEDGTYPKDSYLELWEFDNEAGKWTKL